MIEGSRNKGDWSEFYALVYLLAKSKINSADESLNAISGYYFPIIKIMRNERHKASGIINHMDFVVSSRCGVDVIEVYMDSVLMKVLPASDFQNEADALLVDIPLGTGPQGQFIIPHGERFLNDLYLEYLAASSSDIADIQLSVKDTNTARNQDMGFSIKSFLGGAPTLLNASKATNLIYEISGLTDAQMNTVNAINTRKKII